MTSSRLLRVGCRVNLAEARAQAAGAGSRLGVALGQRHPCPTEKHARLRSQACPQVGGRSGRGCPAVSIVGALAGENAFCKL